MSILMFVPSFDSLTYSASSRRTGRWSTTRALVLAFWQMLFSSLTVAHLVFVYHWLNNGNWCLKNGYWCLAQWKMSLRIFVSSSIRMRLWFTTIHGEAKNILWRQLFLRKLRSQELHAQKPSIVVVSRLLLPAYLLEYVFIPRATSWQTLISTKQKMTWRWYAEVANFKHISRCSQFCSHRCDRYGWYGRPGCGWSGGRGGNVRYNGRSGYANSSGVDLTGVIVVWSGMAGMSGVEEGVATLLLTVGASLLLISLSLEYIFFIRSRSCCRSIAKVSFSEAISVCTLTNVTLKCSIVAVIWRADCTSWYSCYLKKNWYDSN